MHVLPTHPEGLAEVATTVGVSMTAFSATWGNAVAQFMCLYLQPAESRFGFEIMVYRVYVVLGFFLFS
jgi:hypothetical protein